MLFFFFSIHEEFFTLTTISLGILPKSDKKNVLNRKYEGPINLINFQLETTELHSRSEPLLQQKGHVTNFFLIFYF